MIPIQGTINPEVIERELAGLWQKQARANQSDLHPGDERATMRARVANLMVYVANEAALTEVNEVLKELSVRHPCRALVMIGAREKPDRDIEISVASFCHEQSEKSARPLCCEEVSLIAQGRFVVELASATLPLLVPDLSVFLWWRDDVKTLESFPELLKRADRIIIDSADFANAGLELGALRNLFSRAEEKGASISDMNWARLTSWRAMLAAFFDAASNRAALEQIKSVQLDYAAGEVGVAPGAQPLLIAGWLADRLGWKVSGQSGGSPGFHDVRFSKDEQEIVAEFHPVEGTQLQPGRLAGVRLETVSSIVFEVKRSPDGAHLAASVNGEQSINRGRVSPSHTRSVADLLAGEMEILCRDRVWEAAVLKATGQYRPR